jgi:orotidine-5'-phosphate decarboxylase
MLVPGIGAQGGDADAVVQDGPARVPPAGNRPGGGLLVNVGRGIAEAALGGSSSARGTEPAERLAEAARGWAARLPVLG